MASRAYAYNISEKHDAYLNKNSREFCHHYDVIADPARDFKPKVKSYVENAIGIIQGEFFQKYRNRIFTYHFIIAISRTIFAYHFPFPILGLTF